MERRESFMSMRHVSFLTIVAFILAAKVGLAAETRSVSRSCKAKDHCQKSDKKDVPHGSFGLGLNRQGFIVTIGVKGKKGSVKDEAFQHFATFPVFGTNPVICRALGLPVEVLTRYFMAEAQQIPHQKNPHRSSNPTSHSELEKRVGLLLAACHKALLDKDYYRPEKLANSANKTHRPSPAIKETLQPSLPPIDPCLVEALDKVLSESPEESPSDLVVLVKERASCEEQEEQLSPMKAGPSGNQGHDFADMSEFLQELITALAGGVCFDVDFSGKDGMRAKCELQVNGLDFQVLWSDTKPRCRIIDIMSGNK
jgi:hypothetical protein